MSGITALVDLLDILEKAPNHQLSIGDAEMGLRPKGAVGLGVETLSIILDAEQKGLVSVNRADNTVSLVKKNTGPLAEEKAVVHVIVWPDGIDPHEKEVQSIKIYKSLPYGYFVGLQNGCIVRAYSISFVSLQKALASQGMKDVGITTVHDPAIFKFLR